MSTSKSQINKHTSPIRTAIAAQSKVFPVPKAYVTQKQFWAGLKLLKKKNLSWKTFAIVQKKGEIGQFHLLQLQLSTAPGGKIAKIDKSENWIFHDGCQSCRENLWESKKLLKPKGAFRRTESLYSRRILPSQTVPNAISAKCVVMKM